MNLKYYIIALFILACASPQTPTGGDKDVTAPKLFIDSNLLGTNKKPSNIVLNFDENIVVDNNKILFNPKIYPAPVINIKNKQVTINIDDDALLPNTTYSLSLNNAIKDLNESNVGEYPELLFSTGNNIDTQSLFIKSLNYINEKKQLIATDEINTYQYQLNDCCIKTSILRTESIKEVELFIDKNANGVFDSTEIGNTLNNINKINWIYFIKPISSVNAVPYKGGLALLNMPFEYKNYSKFATKNDTTFITDINLISNEIKSRLKINDSLDINFQFTEIQQDTNKILLLFSDNIKQINLDNVYKINGKDTQKIEKKLIIIDNNKVSLLLQEKDDQIWFKTASIYSNNNQSNRKEILIKNNLSYNYIEITNNTANNQICLFSTSDMRYKKIEEISANKTLKCLLPLGKINIICYEDLDQNGFLNHPIKQKTKDKINLLISTECLKNMINTIEINQ